MCTRRYTDPVYLQFIWDAIEFPSPDRNCDFDFILKFVCNERDPKCDAAKLREQLENALRDKCITLSGLRYKKVDWSCISPCSGHDSYCFQCHLPGPVVDCPTCFRVYHESCFKRAFEANAFITFPDEHYQGPDISNGVSSSCLTCRRLANTRLDKETTSFDLRSIYSIVLEKVKGKAPWRTLHTVGYVDEFYRNRYFSFKPMNTRIITDKLRNDPSSEGYPNRTHILADLDLLIHNAAVIYGSKADMTNTARHIRSLLQKELRESSLCVDCYLRSKGGKPDQRQIVEACRKPHKMIWFQYSSWSFRPCKVLYQTNDGYEVICFDGRRERQFVPLNNAVAMTFSASHLGMRFTAPLKRALVEARRYAENQRRITPDFTPGEGLMLCDIPAESIESDYLESINHTNNKSPRVGSKRPRAHTKKKSSSQARHFLATNAGTTSKTEAALDKSRVPTPSLSASCDTLRPVSAVPLAHRLSNNKHSSSLSDSDNDSSISSCSLSTSASGSKRYLSKRPNHRLVAVSSAAKKAVLSSRSSDSTTPATTVGVAATASQPPLPKSSVVPSTRPFLSRPDVTDSDSDSASSPLESCSSRLAGKSLPSSIRRNRSISSSSSTVSSGTVVESDSSLVKNTGSTLNRRKPGSANNEIKRPPKSLKMEQMEFISEKSNSCRPKDVSPSIITQENAAPTGEISKNASVKRGRTVGGPSGSASKPASMPRITVENNFMKRNPLPPVCTTTSSVSSVSPAALSSSSGIGSSVSGDTKSVETSPGDLQCNGHSGTTHGDSTAIKSEDRIQRSMNERLEALTLERDIANRRLRELEQYIRDLEQRHEKEILQTKRSAWCVRCLKQARYYCCPGVAYCSVDCQMKDWTMGHNRVCTHSTNGS
ncbi:Zinc finger MYND domain-containing protein 11 [Echinococcus granulosus]|uniref:Zinc finger MYND domain containing protein 11 n=1 Tax=Echinococcus granulosus TaxID=6210 RepID=A0A068WMX9_ECHGR|nr:Zinc finger MYND domain-containing protein 11 [Echinococcus granulosus]CDS19034.1 zinc finger MYND domain containing protein 11 [Echinococcus granulosus]